MSAPKYKYGHRVAKRRPRKALIVLVLSILVLGAVGSFVYLDVRNSVSTEVAGESRVVSQVLSENSQVKEVKEPFFTMELPEDWKETGRNQNSLYNSISWQATEKGKDNRYLTLYYDRIPADYPVNRLLPVRAQGNTIAYGDLSDKCETFTGTTKKGTGNAVSAIPVLSKWRDVPFMCNIPRFNDNEVGTGTPEAMNSVTVTGPTQGTHKYFFVYADRNFQPDYNILYNALESFQAK